MENKGEHLCVLCNNKLESKEALREHFRKHANKEIDGKGRPVGPNGVVDVTKMRGFGYEKGSASKFVDGEISCDVCGEKFKCNTAAIQHKFKKHPHTLVKHYCPECGMQFPLKIHRDKHLAEHVILKSHPNVKCNDCGAIFCNKTALDYHRNSTHQRIISLYSPVLTPPPSKKIKVNNAGDPQSVYYCHLCGFEYIVKFNLQKHLERQHSKKERDEAPPEMIKCTTCDALFYSQKAYQNHNMYHKPDDLYVTSEQQRLRTVTRVDQDFDIRRVQLGAEKYLPKLPRRRRRLRQPVEIIKPEKESSDEMSPPSSMDTSSDSDSDMPLSKRIKNAEEGSPIKKEQKNETKEEKTEKKCESDPEDKIKVVRGKQKQLKRKGQSNKNNKNQLMKSVDEDSDGVAESDDKTTKNSLS
ncbi:zinc finger protein 284-like [Macrosteles quadrilineatus]|uniref:zinc finger protein 284-like n=1 Tax=Macrosteles quadrilineatus TaxID=74068 RepID=UPI0023E2C7C4|nr:zinc finger protein 284-like [Macrosteles quadrilineatus]